MLIQQHKLKSIIAQGDADIAPGLSYVIHTPPTMMEEVDHVPANVDNHVDSCDGSLHPKSDNELEFQCVHEESPRSVELVEKLSIHVASVL